MGVLDDAADAKHSGRRDDIQTAFYTVQPNRWTFQSDKIRRWVEERLRGRTLNACAGKTRLAHDHEIVRNDIDEDRDAELHADVCEIAKCFDAESFDTIVYDPPFSESQANRSYELEDGEAVVAGNDAIAKRQFDELLAPGGRIIQFGYTATCMPVELDRDGKTIRYEKREAVIWNTLGRMNDYISTMDVKPGQSDAEPRWFK